MIDDFLSALDGKLRFETPQLAFCTHYSWFGITKHGRLGIEGTHLFYNRKPALLSPNLLTFRVDHPDGGSERSRSRFDQPLRILEDDGRGFEGEIAFADSDVLCYHIRLHPGSGANAIRGALLLPATEPRLERRLAFDQQERLLTIHTRVPRSDDRDPDPDHPLTICVRIPDAFETSAVIADGQEQPTAETGFDVDVDGPLVVTLWASAEDVERSEQTFVVGIGEGPAGDRIRNRVSRLRACGSDASGSASANWIERGLDNFSFSGVDKRLRAHYAKAAYQILSNTKSPRGQIGRHSVFPSRGKYCAHYLWDSCFTNLGVAKFNERLAGDFLVALCESQEPDGKIPQFVCATWNRPGESQPPLIAWSAWELYERYGNKELLRSVYDPVCRMVEWWFRQRDEDGDGVVEYRHALESGWDDSPRFDKGRIAAVDLNAFLNREMRLLARMAPELARDMEAPVWEDRASMHAKRMYARLFDPEDRVFYDRLVEDDRLHRVLTPACFTPLWTGVAVPREYAQEMIARYLISPRTFFGARPFPVVAYNDPNYRPDSWWRGPIWPNIAWIMSEVLRVYGYEREHKEAVRRLLDLMVSHDELNELYNSATGEPLGADGLCWTCAVFMDLAARD